VAYLLGYTTTTTPRIASICARYVAKRLKQRTVESPKNEDSISSERELVRRLLAAVKGGLRVDGFAMVCGKPLIRNDIAPRTEYSHHSWGQESFGAGSPTDGDIERGCDFLGCVCEFVCWNDVLACFTAAETYRGFNSCGAGERN
jgi:hypothetical protein